MFTPPAIDGPELVATFDARANAPADSKSSGGIVSTPVRSSARRKIIRSTIHGFDGLGRLNPSMSWGTGAAIHQNVRLSGCTAVLPLREIVTVGKNWVPKPATDPLTSFGVPADTKSMQGRSTACAAVKCSMASTEKSDEGAY